MGKTVLIVEDDDLNMRLFRDLMTVAGYRTLTSGTGANAVDLARRMMPDVILMDIELPDRSGLDTTRILKEDAALCDIPVIAVTAHATAVAERRIRAGGCADYIAKPVSMDGLLTAVRRHLH